MVLARTRQTRSVRRMSDNPSYNPSTSLAYIILAGTSGWAIRHTTKETPWALGTFSFLLGHSLIGALHYSHPDGLEHVKKVYDNTCLIAEVIPLPMINTELYILAGVDQKLALIHALSAFIPIGTQFLTEDHNDKIVDVVLLGNIISLIYLTVTRDAPWAGGLAALTALNHYVFRRISERFEVPKMDMVAICLSFFNVFAVNCLCEFKHKM